MKIYSLSLGLGLLAAIGLASCQPEASPSQALILLMKQNDKLRESISTMETTISQSGEHDPMLLQKIQQAEGNLARGIRELTALHTKNNQDQIRLLELEQRLAAFEAEFRSMQQQAVQAGRPR